MATKIFRVRYSFMELHNGRNIGRMSETKKVVAKDGLDAINKVAKKLYKSESFIDEDSKKKIIITRKAPLFDHIELEAETN